MGSTIIQADNRQNLIAEFEKELIKKFSSNLIQIDIKSVDN